MIRLFTNSHTDCPHLRAIQQSVCSCECCFMRGFQPYVSVDP